jgi:uncharacterized integral membrane protein
MSQLIVIVALAFSILIAIFAVQNTTPVAVSFLTYRADEVAVSVLVLISAALGAIAMLLLGISREITLRWHHRSVSNQLKQSQARVAELERQQPGSAPAPGASDARSGSTPVSDATTPIPAPHE